MSEKRGGFVPFGETGKGHYGKTLGKESSNKIYNRDTFENVLKEVKTIPFSVKESSFNIGDYGAADGAASMKFIKNLIISLRELHGPQIQFQVIYEDQPTNDFNSLFANLSGTLPDVYPFLGDLEGVFPLASGIEFRKQCVPSDSMHFILSTYSVHWLSTTPGNLNDCLHFNSGCREIDAFSAQGQEDWVQFLLMRSKELKKGGVLMVTNPSRSIDESGMNQISHKIFMDILTNTWRSFRNRGIISEEEFEKTTFRFYFYSLDDLKKPFEDTNLSCVKARLRLVSAELIISDSIFYTSWRKKLDEEGVDDRAEFARDYLAANWNWSYGTFLSGLSRERSEAEKHDVLEKLYQKLEREIGRRNPEEFKGCLKNTFLLIRKE